MTWLIIVIIAHLFYALVFVIDKYILSRSLPHPVVYAFYVGILSIAIWVLAPFGFYFPSSEEIILILVAGIAQVAGWIFFYKAIHKGEVSRIIPFVGAFIGIFTLVLSVLIIEEVLTSKQLLAIVLLILGSLIVSLKKREIFQGYFRLAILASLLFAVFWVITKYIFLDTTFVNGIIWIRTGVAVIALTLLISKKNRKLIFQRTEKLEASIVKSFLIGRASGVLAALGIYLAVFLGSVALVNSLQGLQYVFVLILALLLFRKFPKLREEFSREIIIQKIIAIILIGAGLFILVS